MTTPDEHEALVRSINHYLTERFIWSVAEEMPPDECEKEARAVLALVAERLEKPTEAMIEAAGFVDLDEWSAMLAVSPLKPKDTP